MGQGTRSKRKADIVAHPKRTLIIIGSLIVLNLLLFGSCSNHPVDKSHNLEISTEERSLNITVGEFLDQVENFTLNGASMRVEDGCTDDYCAIKIENKSRPHIPAVELLLVPVGNDTYYLDSILYRGNETTSYQEKYQYLSIYLTSERLSGGR